MRPTSGLPSDNSSLISDISNYRLDRRHSKSSHILIRHPQVHQIRLTSRPPSNDNSPSSNMSNYRSDRRHSKSHHCPRLPHKVNDHMFYMFGRTKGEA